MRNLKLTPEPTIDHDVMTERETAIFLRVSERTVFGLAKSGELPCVRIGRRKLFRRSTVEAFLAQREGV